MGINVYQILRYQPGGPSRQHVHEHGRAFRGIRCDAQAERIITIDDSLAPGGATFDTVGMPAGGWNLDGVELQGITNFNNTDGVAILSLAAGVKFNTSSLKLSLLQLTCAPAAAPVISVPALGELWLYLDIAAIMVTGGAAPFLRVDNAGFADIFMAHDSTIGDGTHVVADARSGTEQPLRTRVRIVHRGRSGHGRGRDDPSRRRRSDRTASRKHHHGSAVQRRRNQRRDCSSAWTRAARPMLRRS